MKLDLPFHIFSMNPLQQTAEEHETDFYLLSPCSHAPEKPYNRKSGQEKGNDMTALNTHVIQRAPNSKEP